MKFRLIDASQDIHFDRARLSPVARLAERLPRMEKNRPASRRQRHDMILLAHIRNAFALSNQTYGSPRMAADLKEEGFAVGRMRVARLMRLNGLQTRRK